MAVKKGTHRFKKYQLIREIALRVLLMLLLLGTASADSNLCQGVQMNLRAKRLPVADILDRPTKGAICGDNSCCRSALESQLITRSVQQLDTFLKDSLSILSSVLDTKAKQFDVFFRDMMLNSKREFHEMFEKTYGVIYLQNAYVFTDFFDELEKYYNNGRSRLADVMENFFGILYQRMFTVINAQYHFDENYLVCVADHMTDLKPFGDVPQKLGNQLSRSFVATRTFYRILVMGSEVAKNMARLKISSDCDKQLMQMQFCGVCKGLQGTGACSSYCVHVLSSCLRYHVKLDEYWNNFVDALDKVADRLLGPFNIEMVVGPINIQISDAVMNFQESGEEVSQRVFVDCGNPKSVRSKRYTEAADKVPKEIKPSRGSDDSKGEIAFESLRFNSKRKKKKNKVLDTHPSMEKLIKEIKERIKESSQFWSQLPYQYCNNETVAYGPSSDGNCWNGTTGNYSPPDSWMLSSSPELEYQIFRLQMLVKKLQAAHQGQDVDLIDDSEESLDSSGSGSGQNEIEGSGNRGNSREEITTPTVQPTSSIQPATEMTPRVSVSSASLPRALLNYVLPIILVWFGGAFSDML